MGGGGGCAGTSTWSAGTHGARAQPVRVETRGGRRAARAHGGATRGRRARSGRRKGRPCRARPALPASTPPPAPRCRCRACTGSLRGDGGPDGRPCHACRVGCRPAAAHQTLCCLTQPAALLRHAAAAGPRKPSAQPPWGARSRARLCTSRTVAALADDGSLRDHEAAGCGALGIVHRGVGLRAGKGRWEAGQGSGRGQV